VSKKREIKKQLGKRTKKHKNGGQNTSTDNKGKIDKKKKKTDLLT
jgi:hypothetical protein